MEGNIETANLKGSGGSDPEKAAQGTTVTDQNDEEDVPPDFFDDFSNQDFMEGLDIVDTWDEEGQISDSPLKDIDDENKSEKTGEKEEAIKSILKPAKITIHRSRSRERHKSSEYYIDLRDKLKRRVPNDDLRHVLNEDKKTEKFRRDPEKTKRDILKDKDKCAKDKEVKIINEKLKVVETGLVPPGMEMEVDLRELRKKQETMRKEILKHEEPGKNASEVKQSIRRRPLLPEPRAERYKSRSRSIEYRRFPRERRPRSRSDSRNKTQIIHKSREPIYEHFPKSRSPRRRPRSRSRSPYIPEKHYIVVRERDLSPRFKSRERTRDASPRSDISDREKWLRRGVRRPASPVRRKRSRSSERYKKEKAVKDKKTFLEEIHQKLNETTPRNSPHIPQNHVIQSNFVPVVPQPIPVPQQQQFVNPQMVPPPQYDQQFFIGPCEMPQPVAPPMFMPQSTPCAVPIPVPQMIQLPRNYENPPNTFAQMYFPVSNPNVMQASMQEKQEEEDKKALNKLFEDKKISLSDYLSLRAKTSDTRPVNLHNKINVITRCQEVVKELGGDSKLSGRFYLKKTMRPDKSPEVKFQSPLRRLVSRLRFTTVAKTSPENTNFSNMLTKLLWSTRIQKELPESILKEENTVNQKKKGMMIQCAPTTEKSLIAPKKVLTNKPHKDMYASKNCAKAIQTEPFKCQVCEVRACRRLVDVDVQCEAKTFAEVAVQVTEEFSPWKHAMKNKSLALLTPAQILAQEKEKEEVKKNVFATPSSSPQVDKPAEVTPAKKEKPKPGKPVNRGRGGFNKRRGGFGGSSSKSRPFFEPPNDVEDRFEFDRNRYSGRRFDEDVFLEDFQVDDYFEPRFGSHESFDESDIRSFHDDMRSFPESPEGSVRGGGRFGYKRKRKFWN